MVASPQGGDDTIQRFNDSNDSMIQRFNDSTTLRWPACLSVIYLLAFFHAGAHPKAAAAMGTQAGGWRRPQVAGYLATGHPGSSHEDAQGRSQPHQTVSPQHRPGME